MERLYLCRLCLNRSGLGFSLFVDDIPAKIELLTSIKVAPDDGFPDHCCNSCFMELQNFYKFQQKARQSDKTLREMAQINAGETLQVQDTLACDNANNEVIELQNTFDSLDNIDITDIVGDDIDWNDDNGQIAEQTLDLDIDESTQKARELWNKWLKNLLNYNGEDDNNNLNSSENNVRNLIARNDVTTESLEQDKENCAVDLNTLIADENLETDCPSAKGSVQCSNFNSEKDLRNHKKRHNNFPETVASDYMNEVTVDNRINCNICGTKVKNKKSLYGHIKYKHKDVVHIKCDVCDKKFRTNQQLKVHFKRLHQAINCEICANVHKKNGHFSCPYCKKKFCSKCAKYMHIAQHI